MPVPVARGVHRRGLLRDEVYRSIRQAIVTGELGPGEQLRDTQLEDWLGVSRTPIREALLRLERDGLVSAQPGRRTTVAAEDPERVAQARDVAATLHELAVRTAAERLTDADLTQMDTANDRLRQALETHDAPGAVAADEAFHAVVVGRARNPVLQETLDQVVALLRRSEHLHFGSMTGTASPDQHDQILAALQDGDAEEAVRLTRLNWAGLGEG
ncbi:GntR family transcriptional regulator [Nesterenkonia sp. HG001]|uniref:GntR family transcriptional regulator n=1 Tax=Nesterenkonia sp. HG001 TaxID=2983207 RepID=UPI002AC71D91|nr:GntR family transcriptional regulator [Nesterenkonia sp. HG001]MDZ5076843.1 GntR family transcriptional regulator [Nesterenkonia sp. HG001]